MKRIKEEFLDKVEQVFKLQGKEVLEIGCGSGNRSMQISKRCKSLVAIEPDETVFQFDSTDDFIASLKPKKPIAELGNFLEANNFILRASRRINIFQVI